MKIFLIVLGIIALFCIVAFASIWGSRGTLVTMTQNIDQQQADVQNVYQRRFDLIPNLVFSVDNFMSRQQKTLEGVIEKRQRVIELKDQASAALNPTDGQRPSLEQLQAISTQLSSSLNSFISMVKEAYPEIKGDHLYSDLMNQLEATENAITIQRKKYNDAVKEYNTYRKKDLMAMVAGGLFGFPESRPYFNAQSEAQTAPKASELFNNNNK